MMTATSDSPAFPLNPGSAHGMDISSHGQARSASIRRRTCLQIVVAVLVALVVVAGLIIFFIFASKEARSWFLNYGTVPIVAAIVGWGTNVVALHMTFYPLEYVGCLPNVRIFDMTIFGWQGIIPEKCTKMAGMAVDMMTTQLIDVQEIFSRLDPLRVAEELRTPLENMTPKILETLAMERAPKVWTNLPPKVKEEINDKCLEDSPKAITEMMNELRGDITKVFDLKAMVMEMFERDKQLTNDMFLTCGAKEFQFIKRSGFYLGFLFGLVQMLLWMWVQYWWILPVAGFVVGYLTNFVALKIIFLPVEPRRICCFSVQGLFMKRQNEVAEIYAELVSKQVLTAQNLMTSMIAGPCSDALFEIMDRHIQSSVDNTVRSQLIMNMLVGSQQYQTIKVRVSELIRNDVMMFIPHVTPYIDEALNIRETLRRSMIALTPQDFERLLHPVFEEDEYKLILVGGFLGVVVGLVQALVQVPDQFGI